MAEQYEVDQSASPGSGPDAVIRQEVTIINELGLHARPAAELVLAAKSLPPSGLAGKRRGAIFCCQHS